MVALVDAVAREAMLFGAIGFLVGGLDDLLVDLVYLRARIAAWVRPAPVRPLVQRGGRMAIFVPAWDESAVIGAMLRATLARYDYPDYRIYVGVYPNDPDTIAAVLDVAAVAEQVHMVVCTAPGPTTKADCLNHLWQALCRDEIEEDHPFRAIVLHDAEDLVDPLELRVYATWLVDHDAVQIPVLPLADPQSPFVAGHYLDEFAESHAKVLEVRQALGAALPFAGVGCAIDRTMLGRIAADRGGVPFDETSLTEDYELGLTVAAMGGRTRLARMWSEAGEAVAVRAYFPATLSTAVRQKARWMTGIALAGWDRTGWARGGSLGEHWMRMRDRRATLAIPVLAIAYFALVLWGVSLLTHLVVGAPAPLPDDLMQLLLLVNGGLLAWRIAMRAGFTGAAYGWRQAALSVPRILVANLISLLAARRALMLYWPTLHGHRPRWDKTAHHFPEAAADRTQ
ncbi:MAG: hypothetical protein CVT77_16990 [Alphaproteobacteria bacterium HGW-Alphaproteobacteria-16]|nr:MAG: hypothetical protein CVT77_16990 [Alphaproteobacteria bacterium HGW-Alphaproteobacteria-16]